MHVRIMFCWSSAVSESNESTEADLDAVIAQFGGDVRATIRALLYDIAVLAADFSRSVSHGYVRGRSALGIMRVIDRNKTE